MHLSLGFSSCPNDAFIFDAMVHGKIDTEGIVFDPLIEDVESLNQGALNGHLDITKLSFHAFGYVWDDYVLLNSGSALGRGCGPLVVSKTNQNSRDLDTKQLTVAIPGKYTTANFLFSLVFPEVGDKREILFSEIEDAVLNESVDLGVIIHENRFTFEQRGLVKVLDLGEYWEKETGSPIPLGGIAMKRDKDEAMKLKVDRILKRSVEFAMDNPASSKEYVQELAQEMDEKVIEQHIALYVNDYSVDLGEEGRAAVLCLFEKAIELNIFEQSQLELILTTNKS